jgi:hypothetical protein
MRIKGSGNVGIGTPSPSAKLDVAGAINTTLLTFGPTEGQKISLYHPHATIGIGYQPNLLQIHTHIADADIAFGYGSSASFTERMRITGSGHVGIGVSDPKAPLHVKRYDGTGPGSAGNNLFTRKSGSDTAYGVYLSSNGGLFWYDGASPTIGNNETIKFDMISAIFEGELISRGGYWSGYSLSYSDARAKTLLGVSDASSDLSLLRNLRVRDFTWIDRTVDGHRPNKKLIAQEVESIFPQAVRRTPRPTAIPNVYQVAEKVEFDATRQELRLTVGKAHELKVGDSVDLATDATPMREMKVTAVSGEREFTVSCETAPKSVFVYGKYVTDFRAVDYEAIAMLNVSATQELARQVEALKASEARNAELAKRVAELEAKDRARDAKLASIEKLLQANHTVMASPAKPANSNGQE